MKKHLKLFLALITFTFGMVGFQYHVHAVRRYVQSTTPTIFVHG